MGKKINLIGTKFGRLTVINEAVKTNSKFIKWLCKCECGNYVSVFGNALKSGSTLSCGCLKSQRAKETHTTHGHGTKTPEYIAYTAMKSRCYDINNDGYNDYGGRGIIVCDRWLGANGFINFLSDMGKKPSTKHSIDRFPNNGTGIYEPTNCRWATHFEQSRNLRSNVWLEYEGIKMIMADWTKELDIHHDLIRYHLKTGKTFPEIVKRFQNIANAASSY